MDKKSIIWENELALVINKPAGLVVNRAESVKQETLQDWLESNFEFPIFSFEECRSGIVHRLDKDTSGVMIVAKTQDVFELLQAQFKKREVEKQYLALVHGKIEPREGSVVLPLGRSVFDRKKFSVKLEGKQSETRWEVKDYFIKDGEVLTLVKLFPKTGRTHQLRVHLNHIRHPIVGDKQYLSKKRFSRDSVWCERQFLHAQRLKLRVGEKMRQFKADLSDDLESVLCNLNLMS